MPSAAERARRSVKDTSDTSSRPCQVGDLFKAINTDPETRCVVLSAIGKTWTAGLDLMEAASGDSEISAKDEEDVTRAAFRIANHVRWLQEVFTNVEACR